MSRMARLLTVLETRLAVGRDELAQVFGVGPKTITTSVRELDKALGSSAAVVEQGGRYRFVVLDAGRYADARRALLRSAPSLNDDALREALVFLTLLTRGTARLSDLSERIHASRGTVIAVVAELRKHLTPHGVGIIGTPHVGLALEGTELAIRLAATDLLDGVEDPTLELPEDVVASILAVASDRGLNVETAHSLARWVAVAALRDRAGFTIDSWPFSYDALDATAAGDLASAIVARLSSSGVRLDAASTRFIALPVAAMRASAASRSAEPFREHGESTDLTRAMLAAVSEELDLPLSDERMRQEFAAHVTFLVNRLTYKVGAQADVLADFPQTYPLAHYMASIAAHELGRYLGTEVPEAEVALLATYFQLFLDDRTDEDVETLRIAIVHGPSVTSARLVASELRLMAPTGLVVALVPMDELDEIDLGAVDLVVTTLDADLPPEAHPLVVAAAADRQELARLLGTLRYGRVMGRPLVRGVDALLVALLDSVRFVVLEGGRDYLEMLEALLAHLLQAGVVDSEFASTPASASAPCS